MEDAYMEDAEFTTEQCICSLFITQSTYIERDELIKRLSNDFNLPIEVINQIIEEEIKEDIKFSYYLESLSTKELDSIYSVLVRNIGNQPKTNLIIEIEKIVSKRIL
jgi:hypothetical protein